MSLKAKVEAILYLTDKPLRAQAVAAIVGEEVQLVRQVILELIHEYEERQGGLEIADEDGYSFRVRDQYSALMDEFMPMEISMAYLRTLSAIAIKQPITQAEIIGIRGASAYEHIKELVVRDLVAKKDDGRSPILTTTKKFQDYFRLSKDGKSLRQYLKREMKKRDKEEAEQLSILPDSAIFVGESFVAESFAPAVQQEESLPEEQLLATENNEPELEPTAAAPVEVEVAAGEPAA
ncbi:MAG: SMC-Scp complex subunit ScpB [Candidatus Obscuribacterales bacterium]|nr:SMC-Scp complex subunit ScpB [Candidatus Obscuribacterales bacterium]